MSVFGSMLNHPFFGVRKTRSSDGSGGFSIGYEALPDFFGRLRPANSKERETAMRDERSITHVLYTFSGENLRRGDYVSPGGILIDGDQITAFNLLVEVQGVRNPSTAFEHWEIDCLEIQEELDYPGVLILPWEIGSGELGEVYIP